jgi:hypothetical protein
VFAVKEPEEGVEAAGSVYEYHSAGPITNGNRSRLSEKGIAEVGSYLVSASGADVFFESPLPLVQEDTNASVDLYDARTAGGFAPAAPRPECSGEECQGAPSSHSLPAPPGSAFARAGGNVVARLVPTPAESSGSPSAPAKALTRVQKLSKALKRCRKMAKKRRARCVRRAKARYRAPSQTTKSSARGR